MKRQLIIMTLLAVIVFGFSACEEGTSSGSRPLMTALVNGSNWRCPEPHGRVSDNAIIIYGTSAEGQTIQMTIFSGETGQYNLNSVNQHEGILIPNTSPYATTYSTNYSESGSGVVYISSVNQDSRVLAGTFYFKAYKPDGSSYKNITQGKFQDVPYKYISTVDTTGFNNLFSANVEGELWEPQTIVAFETDTSIVVKASKSDWEIIEVIFPTDVNTGIQDISPGGPVWASYQLGFDTYNASAGSATVSSHDMENNELNGTFFFNVEDNEDETIPISEGSYSIQYTAYAGSSR